MKVLFTLDTLANAGTEKSTLDIIKNFSKDTRAKVVYFYTGHDLKAAYEEAGIPLIFVNLKSGYSFAKGIRALKKIIKSEQPDLVVSSIYRANLISRVACRLTKTPLVGTFVNDSYGEVRLDELKAKHIYWKFRFFWLLDKWTSFIPTYWIANAKSIALSNAKTLGIAPDKIKVIYRGRNSVDFHPWIPPHAEAQFRFVAVGRLLQRKGFSELLEAFGICKKTYPGISLDIYGEGKYRPALEKLIEKNQLNDRVTLKGVVPNAWKKLYDYHCFLFPSWYEGFSGALVEAMMAGIPIIASDIPMNLEAVTANKTALVHTVKNKEVIAQKMALMINDYPAMIEMGKRARLEAIDRFDIKNISREYEEFLKEIINAK